SGPIAGRRVCVPIAGWPEHGRAAAGPRSGPALYPRRTQSGARPPGDGPGREDIYRRGIDARRNFAVLFKGTRSLRDRVAFVMQNTPIRGAQSITLQAYWH